MTATRKSARRSAPTGPPTTREYFAAAALTGLLASRAYRIRGGGDADPVRERQYLAENAWRIADVMLAATTIT